MRLFLAVDLPDSFRSALHALRDRLSLRHPGWRWVDPCRIHLTLRFLGEIDEATDRRLRRSWRNVAARRSPFRLYPGQLGQFPESGRPRVLWLEARDDPAAAAGTLAGDLELAASAGGLAPEHRPFRGHFTLARARRGHRVCRPGEEGIPEEMREESATVNHVVLYRSELLPEGPRYTALERFPLAAPSDAEGVPD